MLNENGQSPKKLQFWINQAARALYHFCKYLAFCWVFNYFCPGAVPCWPYWPFDCSAIIVVVFNDFVMLYFNYGNKVYSCVIVKIMLKCPFPVFF